MRITQYSDYALRVLIYLAVRDPDKNGHEQLPTISNIAESYGISKNHLMKVVQQLNQMGYSKGTRGRQGGLQLLMRPEDINIGQLIRRTEQDFALVDCMSLDGNCRISPVCSLKHALNEALDAFLKVLDGYTLADILPNQDRSQLIDLLELT